jgi:type VI protein secretion system component VasK
LYGEMFERLQEERDLQRRAAAYRFPQQFRGLGPLIEQFLDAAFISVPGTPEPLLRGVYFTSGTQEGSPIDRVLGTLARSFGLERAAGPALAGSGKSFFLMRLLREVIFPESGLAGSDQGIERRQHRSPRSRRSPWRWRRSGPGAIGAIASTWRPRKPGRRPPRPSSPSSGRRCRATSCSWSAC